MTCKRTIVIMVILVSMLVMRTASAKDAFDMFTWLIDCVEEDCQPLPGATFKSCLRPCINLCKEVKKNGNHDIYDCTFNCVNYQCLPYIPFATWYQCLSECHSACKDAENGGDSAQLQASLFKNYKRAVPPAPSPNAL